MQNHLVIHLVNHMDSLWGSWYISGLLSSLLSFPVSLSTSLISFLISNSSLNGIVLLIEKSPDLLHVLGVWNHYRSSLWLPAACNISLGQNHV